MEIQPSWFKIPLMALPALEHHQTLPCPLVCERVCQGLLERLHLFCAPHSFFPVIQTPQLRFVWDFLKPFFTQYLILLSSLVFSLHWSHCLEGQHSIAFSLLTVRLVISGYYLIKLAKDLQGMFLICCQIVTSYPACYLHNNELLWQLGHLILSC